MLMTGNAIPPVVADKTRISLSVSKDLLKDFDSLSRDLGHSNRSVAVGEAMRELLTNRKWDLGKKGTAAGAILLTYDHHHRGINAALTELQHDYPDVVTATMHVHLSKHTCLEIIAFKGEGSRVRALAKTLQSNKGVLSLKVLTSAV